MRERLGLSQDKLASAFLNPTLDRKYSSATVSAWELGHKPIPGPVSAFLDQLEMEQALGDGFLSDHQEPPPRDDDRPDDIPPSDLFEPQGVIGPTNIYARTCEELWQMIAMGVGLTGAVLGSERLQQDGAIIDGDKKALGKAYGKLAETNETFRKMLVGATSSGAWLEVCFVTGQTAAKIWHNHSATMGELVHLPPQPDEATAS